MDIEKALFIAKVLCDTLKQGARISSCSVLIACIETIVQYVLDTYAILP